MSRVNDVHAGIWGEDDFLDLTAPGKLLYLWSFTNPRCGMSGVYTVSRRVMSFDTGMHGDHLARALGELERGRFVIYADGVLFVRTRVKHLRTKSRQIAKSIASDVRRLTTGHPVREAFMAEYGSDEEWGGGQLFACLHGASPEPPQEPHPNLTEPHRGSMDVGRGTGQVVEGEITNAGRAGRSSKSEPDGFTDWLAYHAERSGRRVPGERTGGRADLARSFAALVAEGFTFDDFKLATDGVLADQWKRENGHDKFVTVLRKTKFGELVEDGRRARTPHLRPVPNGNGQQWRRLLESTEPAGGAA
jgi:hypothetical protein